MKRLLLAALLTVGFSPALSACAATTTVEPEAGTVAEIAAGNPDFSTLVTALEAAGLVEVLSGSGPFTVFAPTDEAFAAIPEAELEALLADTEVLTAVLLYHVVPGTVTSEDVLELESGATVETVQGSPITITLDNGTVMVDGATVIATDIIASNGVIHVIDAVILPPQEAM